jgi:hypothetical protein
MTPALRCTRSPGADIDGLAITGRARAAQHHDIVVARVFYLSVTWLEGINGGANGTA